LCYTSNILLTWKLWNWGWHCPVDPSPGYAPGGNRILIPGCRSAQEFLI